MVVVRRRSDEVSESESEVLVTVWGAWDAGGVRGSVREGGWETVRVSARCVCGGREH